MCQLSEGRPFPSNKELLAHVVSSHQRRICTICLQVGTLHGFESLNTAWKPLHALSYPQRFDLPSLPDFVNGTCLQPNNLQLLTGRGRYSWSVADMAPLRGA